jgi:peptidoglycan/xylan/chitin deacetylase (PgdA/CDA1 family)
MVGRLCMAKKKSKHKHQKSKFKVYLLTTLFVVLFGLFCIGITIFTAPKISRSYESLPITTSKSAQIKTASPSAAVTPSILPKPATKSANFIPQSSGRSITVPVLYYHYVGDNPNPADKARDSLSITPDRFEEEMAYLSNNGYNSVSLETLYNALKGNGGLPSKAVILTFDDGYKDFYFNAYPILRRYNIQATVFIPTGLMGTSYYLTWDQIKEMQGSGIIHFEAHSVSHANLAGMSGEALKVQIEESKKQLEAQIGVPVNFFAYPYGASSPEAWQKVKDAGFLAAFGTWYSKVHSEGTIFNLPRERMGGAITIENFAGKL